MEQAFQKANGFVLRQLQQHGKVQRLGMGRATALHESSRSPRDELQGLHMVRSSSMVSVSCKLFIFKLIFLLTQLSDWRILCV